MPSNLSLMSSCGILGVLAPSELDSNNPVTRMSREIQQYLGVMWSMPLDRLANTEG